MKTSKRLISLAIVLIMLLGSVVPAFAANNPTTPLADVTAMMRTLEAYAAQYAQENPGTDPIELEMNFIRSARYSGGNWDRLAGVKNQDFIDWVYAQDNNMRDLRRESIMKFVLAPNGNTIDVQHMFGTMNMTYYNNYNVMVSDLGGWAGDLGDLLLQIEKNNVTVTDVDFEEKVEFIKTAMLGGDYYYGDDNFDEDDIYGDLDAYHVMKRLQNSGEAISDIFDSYLNDTLTNENRAKYFLLNRLPGAGGRAGVRTALYNAYLGNALVLALENSRGLNITEAQRKAACYALADYLYELYPVENQGGGIIDDPNTNDFYTIFSSKTTNLAPGITQTVRYANTTDDKQVVYYYLAVDVARDDVSMFASYGNNDATTWSLQTVSDQMAASTADRTDPTSDQFIENYTPIAGVNADFFNMNTGEPSGVLMMNGVQYHGPQIDTKTGQIMTGRSFFAIMKDGTPVIDEAVNWDNYKDDAKEAVGGHVVLVRDGQILQSSSSDYYKTRAPRTCIGIREDGKVVMVVIDGRQEPFSTGASQYEAAQVMLDAGCVIAINLDGGGSSTFVAKQEGADHPTIINSPSDGYARKVSSALTVASTAVIDNSFNHAVINADNEYLTVGMSTNLEAIGVSGSGGSAELPADATWVCATPNIGSITPDGEFTATGLGTAIVTLVSEGRIIGSTAIYIVEPNGLVFEKTEFTSIYGETIKLLVKATYDGNEVLISDDTDLIEFTLTTPNAGTMNGLYFTAAAEETGIRSTTVNARIAGSDEILASAVIYLYKEDEAMFDFNNATAGDRKLAWLREVSNSVEIGEGHYYAIDPDQPIDVSYTFAIDMNDLAIPDNILEALPVVAQFLGTSPEGLTAWQLILALAERISPSSVVDVYVDVDPNFTPDFTDTKIVCDFFELTSIEYDEELHKIHILCNWKKVYGAIDPETANPLCMVTGLKIIPNADAAWDENGQLAVCNSGVMTYQAGIRSTQAYNLAGGPLGEQYGLYPYDNTENLAGDKGASFGNTHASFTDEFTINNNVLDGWVLGEEGSEFYYINNVKITDGLYLLPDPETGADRYFTFNADGVCTGKYTGYLEDEGGLRYVLLGEMKTGWREIDGNYYFFDRSTGYAVDGDVTVDGFNYRFENRILVRGAFVNRDKGVSYYWAAKPVKRVWFEADGDWYCADAYEYLKRGIVYTYSRDDENRYGYFVFDGTTGRFMEEVNGPYEYEDNLYYVSNGEVVPNPGLVKIGDDFYYFGGNNYAIKNQTGYYISKTNGLLEAGHYDFDADGKLIFPEPIVLKNGIVRDEDGVLRYYIDGKTVYAGLIDIDGDRYYVRSNGALAIGKYYVVKHNGLLDEMAYYNFDNDGKMIITEAKNGIIREDGKLWYYEKDVKTYRGLFEQDGEYYYAKSTGEVVSNCKYYVVKHNGLLDEMAWYEFDENGCMIHAQQGGELKCGIIRDEDGVLRYYVEGATNYAGLIEIDGDYYYVRSSGELAIGRYYVVKTNDLMPMDYYEFDNDGKMIFPEPVELKNGIVRDDDGVLRYYVDGETYYAGLIVIDGNTYYVRSNGALAIGRYYVVVHNGLLDEMGYHNFDDNGVMVD